MAVGVHKMMLTLADGSYTPRVMCLPSGINIKLNPGVSCRTPKFQVSALTNGNGSGINNKGPPSSNYVVPLDKASCLIRPLAEIFRDLNKRIPDNIIKSQDDNSTTVIPWYQANRMLSFYAPGWCGEIRDVIFSDSSVTVVYRITIRGVDGEAYRESTGTVSIGNNIAADPVSLAEQIAFCRACARFGLGLYLYHEDLKMA